MMTFFFCLNKCCFYLIIYGFGYNDAMIGSQYRLRLVNSLKNQAMKTLKITLAVMSFIAVSVLTSCGKKCNGPHEHHGKHNCTHQDTTSSAPTATASSSGT
jgi:hypothetical protein